VTDQGRTAGPPSNRLRGVAADPSLRGHPGGCTVCHHGFVDEINRALVLKTMPVVAVSQRFKLSTDALFNHLKKHLSNEDKELIIADTLQKPVAVAHLDVQHALIRLTERVDKALAKAEEMGDPRTIAAVAAEARKLVELSARVLGGLSATDSRAVILADNDQWLKVRDHLYAWVATQSDNVRASFIAHMRKLNDAGALPDSVAE
jgi:hypothetical protein